MNAFGHLGLFLSAPAAPTDLLATPGNTQITLTWDFMGGTASYNVKESTTPGGPYATISTGSSLWFNHTGLANGTTYYYVVSTVVGGVEGPNSDEVSATPSTPTTVPAAPTIYQATPYDGRVEVGWTAVAGASGYRVKYSLAPGGPYTVSSTTKTASPLYVAGLTNGTTYYFVVTALNTIGESATSNEVAATPEGVPPAPVLSGVPGNKQATLSWVAVPYATSYNLYRSTSQTGTYVRLGAYAMTATSYTDTGLTNGTTYYYYVVAGDPAGYGANSNIYPVTPTALPGAPSSLTAVGGNNQVALSWAVGSGATSYTVWRSGTSQTGYAQVASGVTTTAYTDPTATNGSTYYYVVSAVNAAGSSTYSNEAPVTLAPNAPGDLTATGGNGQVSLSWPASPGATSYVVSRSTTQGTGYTSIATNVAGTIYTDSTVTNGTTYYYVVQAVNAGGSSGYSKEASATPEPPAPAKPTNLKATAGDSQVSLTWTGSDGAANYTVLRSTTQGTGYASVATNVAGTTYTDSTATNGTTYYYVVVAVNSGGSSDYSNEASATPEPPAPTSVTLTATAGDTVVNLNWSATGATNYVLQHGPTSNGPWTTVYTGTGTSTPDTNLVDGTTYYYLLTASNGGGSAVAETNATPTVSALTLGTTGTDFWLAFPPCGTFTDPNHTLTISISSQTAASGTVTVSSDGSVTNFSIPAGGGIARIPIVFIQQINVPYVTPTAELTVVAGIHVVSNNPVAVSTLNFFHANSEGFTALPTPMLGTSYVLMSYPTDANGDIYLYSQLVLLATVNNTAVTITPSCTTGTRVQGVPYTITLNAGQAYAFQAREASKDLTGSIVTSSQPIALYSGAQGAFVPAHAIQATNPLIEQEPSVDRWGTDFYTVPYATRTAGDVFRILASRMDTTVWVNGTLAATLNLGETTSVTLSAASEITSDKPILVAQISQGSYADGNQYSDPFMVLVPPTAGYSKCSLVATSDNSYFANGYVNIVALTSSVGDVTLDGAVVAPSAFSTIGTSGYSAASVKVNPGSHTVTTAQTGSPVCAIGYGYGSYEGYGYPGSSALPKNGFDWSLVAAPTNLAAFVISATEIDLTWTNNASNATGIEIDVQIAGGPWTVLVVLDPSETSFHDTGLEGATQYAYRVRAISDVNYASSNIVNAKTMDNVPDAPMSLVATAQSATQIMLVWAHDLNEAGFKIERLGSDGVTWSEIGATAPFVTYYSDNKGLTPLTTYSYRVRATNASGDSGYSNIATATTLDNPPSAPSYLVATPSGYTTVHLNWQDNSTNELGFYVERSPDGTSWSRVASVGANTTTCDDPNLNNGTTYYYRVQAYNDGGASSYSNMASVTLPVQPPATPSGLRATTISGSQIALNWTDNSNNEQGFVIQHSTDGGVTWSQAGTVGPGVTTFPDGSLTPSATYWYRVYAYNVGGNSGYSNVTSATTLAAGAATFSIQPVQASCPPSADPAAGHLLQGSLASTLAADGDALQAATVLRSSGQFASIQLSFDLGSLTLMPGGSSTLNLACFAGTTQAPVSISVFVYNNSTKAWVNVSAATPAPTSLTTIPITVTNATLAPCVSTASNHRLLCYIQSQQANGAPANLNVEQALLSAQCIQNGNLPVPTWISSSHVGGSATLTWQTTDSTDAVHIQRKTGDGGDFTDVDKVLPAGTTSFTDSKAAQGATYYYRVRSENLTAGTQSPWSTLQLIKTTAAVNLASIAPVGGAPYFVGGGSCSFTVSLTDVATTPTTVQITFPAPTSQGGNWVSAGSVTIPAGQCSAVFNTYSGSCQSTLDLVAVAKLNGFTQTCDFELLPYGQPPVDFTNIRALWGNAGVTLRWNLPRFHGAGEFYVFRRSGSSGTPSLIGGTFDGFFADQSSLSAVPNPQYEVIACNFVSGATFSSQWRTPLIDTGIGTLALALPLGSPVSGLTQLALQTVGVDPVRILIDGSVVGADVSPCQSEDGSSLHNVVTINANLLRSGAHTLQLFGNDSSGPVASPVYAFTSTAQTGLWLTGDQVVDTFLGGSAQFTLSTGQIASYTATLTNEQTGATVFTWSGTSPNVGSTGQVSLGWDGLNGSDGDQPGSLFKLTASYTTPTGGTVTLPPKRVSRFRSAINFLALVGAVTGGKLGDEPWSGDYADWMRELALDNSSLVPLVLHQSDLTGPLPESVRRNMPNYVAFASYFYYYGHSTYSNNNPDYIKPSAPGWQEFRFGGIRFTPFLFNQSTSDDDFYEDSLSGSNFELGFVNVQASINMFNPGHQYQFVMLDMCGSAGGEKMVNGADTDFIDDIVRRYWAIGFGNAQNYLGWDGQMMGGTPHDWWNTWWGAWRYGFWQFLLNGDDEDDAVTWANGFVPLVAVMSPLNCNDNGTTRLQYFGDILFHIK